MARVHTAILLRGVSVIGMRRVSKLAETDPLTQAPDQRALMGRLESILRKGDKPTLWLAMLDLDNFKNINDDYGHDVGNNVLINFANLIIRKEHLVYFGRLGGEEFGLILCTPTAYQATGALYDLLQTLKNINAAIKYSLSDGLAHFKDAESVTTLL